MKKKLIVPIFSLIGLMSFVVLGSSPDLVGTILESAQNNPITRIFSTHAEEKNAEDLAANVQNSEILQKRNSTIESSNSPNEVPEIVLWSSIFSISRRLEQSAQKARQEGKDDSLFTNFFTVRGKLSPENHLILIKKADAYFIEIELLREKAKILVKEFRAAKLSESKLSNGGEPSMTHSTSAEILELKKKYEEITFRYRDEFKNDIGEESSELFLTFINGDFANGFSLQDDQQIIDKEIPSNIENRGFEPTNKSVFLREFVTGGNEK